MIAKHRSFFISNTNITLMLILSSFIGVSISYGDFYLFHLILFFVLLIRAYQLKVNNYKLRYTFLSKKYVPTLIMIFLWYLLSLFWTPNFELGIKYNFYIFCGLILTLSIISFSSDLNKLNKLFKFLSIFVFIEISISMIESFTSFRMPISSYSQISQLFGKDPVNFSSVNNSFLSPIFTPPTGFRWNTNDLAICMIIVLPFFLCNKNTMNKALGILLITTIIIMTASRAVFLALLLVYSLYLLFVKKKAGTLFLIWTTTLTILWGMSQLRESENPRINELANSIEALTLYLSGDLDIEGSLSWRRELVDNGLNAFLNTYGIGVGAGGTVANQEMIGPVAGRFTSMHNFWIELLVEGGVLVAIITFLWFVSMIYRLFIISRKNTDDKIKYFSQSLFLSLIAFIPAAIAASSTIYFFPMWIMFGFAISVISLADIKPIRRDN